MWRSFVAGVGAFAAVSMATPARAQDHDGFHGRILVRLANTLQQSRADRLAQRVDRRIVDGDHADLACP